MLGGGVYRKVKVLAMADARRRAAVTAPPANTTYRVYYYAGGKPIAMRVMPPNDATGTLYYLHSDHLGSTSVTTNASGGAVARQWYYPYGSVRGSVGTLPTQRTFTGQYSDPTGLMYFNARYYSQTLGRFVSADTIVPGAGNPQNLNRYAFVLNNPIKYADPSGHCIWDACIAELLIVAAAIGMVPVAIDYAQTAFSDPNYFGFGSFTDPSQGGVLEYVRDRGAVVWGVSTMANVVTMGFTTSLIPGQLALTDAAVNSLTSNATLQVTGRIAATGAVNAAVSVAAGVTERGILGEEDFLSAESAVRDATVGALTGTVAKGWDELGDASVRAAREAARIDIYREIAREQPNYVYMSSLTKTIPTKTKLSQFAYTAGKVIDPLYQFAAGVNGK